MPLTYATPEDDVNWALLGRLRDFIYPGDSLHHPLTDIHRLVRPVQAVHVVGLEDLKSTGLERAKQSCWRYLAGLSPGQAAGAEVSLRQRGKEPMLNGLFYGPQVTHLVHSVDRFESQYKKIYKEHKHTFELRILSIPGLLIEAFWLKRRPANVRTNPARRRQPAGGIPATDRIIPFLSAYRRKVEFMRDYPAGEFLAEVKKWAADRLETAKASDVKAGDPYVLTQ